jgi:L-alanine-DL-glutamate epimerase-like enolase superfamily enzyme
MRRIAGHRIHWCEEPLPPQDVSGYAELRRRALIPLAAGEALYTAWDFKRLLDAGGVDVVQPDISLCGGLRAAREIALRLDCTMSAFRRMSGAARSDWLQPAISSRAGPLSAPRQRALSCLCRVRRR